MFSIIPPALLFFAFLLLLLVSLSAPIIKSLILFQLTAHVGSTLLNTGASGFVIFGVWGYCVSTIDVSVAKISHTISAECSKAHLGFTFDKTVANTLHVGQLQNLITRTTTAVLVLHPIAAALTFITFFISLLMLQKGSNGKLRFPSLFILGIGLSSAIVTTTVFLIDIILVAVVRHRVSDASNGHLQLSWGNAVWMILGATIASWLAIVSAGVYTCGHNSMPKEEK